MADLLLEIARLAVEFAGLEVSAIPRRSLQRALERRLRETRLASSVAYMGFLREKVEEREQFLEEVLVPETFFFRDAGAFAEMRRWCLDWIATQTGPLRILSAPCATGEEPYSIAAMLLDAGVAAEQFVIEAADISAVALARARAALYQDLSLRNFSGDEVPSFLERTRRGWMVKPAVRQRVHFRQLNLVQPDAERESSLAASGPYHLICSRNLCLYQTAAARRTWVATLAEVIAPGGRLVIGAADWCAELAERFDLTGPPKAFALRPKVLDSVQASTGSPDRQEGRSAAVQSARTPRAATTTPAGAEARSSRALPKQQPAKRPPGEDDLETPVSVVRLYDRAMAALVAGRGPDAERLCRQALYLDGSHVPSLELLRRLWAPAGPERMRRALDARLARHRGSSKPPEESAHAR